jgi:hypothetical protein
LPNDGYKIHDPALAVDPDNVRNESKKKKKLLDLTPPSTVGNYPEQFLHENIRRE